MIFNQTMRLKYEFTSETKTLPDGTVLRRIKSLINSEYANVGELGGFIENESNLPHDFHSWVANEAMVYGNAVVTHDALVSEHAVVCDHAVIAFGAKISGHAHISGYARIGYGSIISGKCSLNYFTDASEVIMEGFNHVIRKGKSDRLYSKSEFNYSLMESNKPMNQFIREFIKSATIGIFGGLVIGAILLIFHFMS